MVASRVLRCAGVDRDLDMAGKESLPVGHAVPNGQEGTKLVYANLGGQSTKPERVRGNQVGTSQFTCVSSVLGHRANLPE